MTRRKRILFYNHTRQVSGAERRLVKRAEPDLLHANSVQAGILATLATARIERLAANACSLALPRFTEAIVATHLNRLYAGLLAMERAA